MRPAAFAGELAALSSASLAVCASFWCGCLVCRWSSGSCWLALVSVLVVALVALDRVWWLRPLAPAALRCAVFCIADVSATCRFQDATLSPYVTTSADPASIWEQVSELGDGSFGKVWKVC